jgi:hypothetical protein
MRAVHRGTEAVGSRFPRTGPGIAALAVILVQGLE